MQNINISQLKAIEALSNVPDQQLQWLIDVGELREYEQGDTLFSRGDAFNYTYIILQGRFRFHIVQGQNNTIKELGIVEKGAITGYLPFSRGKVAMGYGSCIQQASVLLIPAEELRKTVGTHYELTEALVHVMTTRVRFFTTQQQQNEKMYALGKLSAGLAHELNNPASAIVSNASYLAGQLKDLPGLFKHIAAFCPEEEEFDKIHQLLNRIGNDETAGSLTLMEKSDLEDEVATWLEEHGINDYALAANIVEEGVTMADIESLSQAIPQQSLEPSLQYIHYQLSINRMVSDIIHAAQRISTLVGAVKTYSHMDRGGDSQMVDINNGIETTLTILNHKFKKGNVTIHKNLDPALPHIKGMAGELNQVWTNILDNAIDAIDEQKEGAISISTSFEDNRVKVVVQDNGPGIPEELQQHIFDPFFTTKQIGKGTGLGLDVVTRIVDRHNGRINVNSQPGNTVFEISLPLNND